MKVVWTPFALVDRNVIFDYIETNNPEAAADIDGQIVQAARRLMEFPESGRPGGIPGTRELVIPRTPYIAACAVSGGRVRILRILHGAQLWPDDIKPGGPRSLPE